MKDIEEKIKNQVHQQILDSKFGEEMTDKETRNHRLENLKAGYYDEDFVTVTPRDNLPHLNLQGFSKSSSERAITRTVH